MFAFIKYFVNLDCSKIAWQPGTSVSRPLPFSKAFLKTETPSMVSDINQCPYELSNGDLELSCKRNPGDTCNYACHLGYLPSNKTEPTTATCGSSLSWSRSLSSLCQSKFTHMLLMGLTIIIIWVCPLSV